MDRDKRSAWLGVSLLWVVGILVVTLIFPGGAAAQSAYPTIHNSAPAASNPINYWTPARVLTR